MSILRETVTLRNLHFIQRQNRLEFVTFARLQIDRPNVNVLRTKGKIPMSHKYASLVHVSSIHHDELVGFAVKDVLSAFGGFSECRLMSQPGSH